MSTYIQPTDATREPTEEQLAVIRHQEGPCVVLAGPGAGKTFTLVRRQNALVVSGAPTQSVLLLTYSNAAAAELQRRTQLLEKRRSERGGTSVFSGAKTFHALAIAAVKEYYSYLKLAVPPKLNPSTLRQNGLIDSITKNSSLRTANSDDIYSLLALLETSGVTPSTSLAWLEENGAPSNLKYLEVQVLAGLFNSYINTCNQAGNYSFDGLIRLAINLIRDCYSVRTKLKDELHYVMVDEFQDTSPVQLELLNALTETLDTDKPNVLVVADSEQSIYGFRGADGKTVDRFRKMFPLATELPLTLNYRCAPPIIAAADAVLRQQRGAAWQKRASTVKTGGSAVDVLAFSNERDEATEVAIRIEALVKDGTPLGEIAVLARFHNQLELVCNELNYRGIANWNPASMSTYKSSAVKHVVNLIWASQCSYENRADRIASLLRGPYRLGQITKDRLVSQLKATKTPLLEATTLNEAEYAKVRELRDVLTAVREAKKDGALAMAYAALNAGGLRRLLATADTFATLVQLASLDTMLDQLSLHQGEGGSLDDWCDQAVNEINAAGKRRGDSSTLRSVIPKAVHIGTLHGAKGLEFNHVFVLGLSQDRYDWSFNLKNKHLSDAGKRLEREESERLLYVGITRAQSQATLTYAQDAGRASALLEPLLEVVPAVHCEVQTGTTATAPAIPIQFEYNLDQLSYTHLSTYRRCPLAFAYEHLWKVPVSVSFSNVVGGAAHKALEEATRLRSLNQPIDLESCFEVGLRGFSYRAHNPAEVRKKAEELVLSYLESPMWLESAPLAAEWRFTNVSVGEDKFTGSIDRLDVLPDNAVRVVDYKSGQAHTEVGEREALQMAVYNAAVRNLRPGTSSVEMEFHYLDSGTKLRLTEEDIQTLDLGALSAAIRSDVAAKTFTPTATPASCSPCSFTKVCPNAQTE